MLTKVYNHLSNNEDKLLPDICISVLYISAVVCMQVMDTKRFLVKPPPQSATTMSLIHSENCLLYGFVVSFGLKQNNKGKLKIRPSRVVHEAIE